LQECSGRILDLLDATGAVLLIDAQPYCFGLVPAEEQLEALLEWLRGQNYQGSLATNYLAENYPAAAEFGADVAGLLATPLTAGGRNGMLWFRRERLRTIQWAGRPEKQMEPDAQGDWRISPRKSFASWQEIWRGRSDHWTAQEVSSAEVLAHTLIEAMLQKGLKQRDEFYRLFGDQTPEMIVRLAPDGCFTYLSPTAYIVLGKRPAELLGSPMQALIEEVDQADFMQMLADASDEMSSAVFRVHNAGRQPIWLEMNIKRIKRTDGEPELIAISRDVSERQKFLLATEEFQQLNQTLLEAEGEGIVAVDCCGAVIYSNPRACELLGWKAEELLGKNAHLTLHHSRPDGTPFPESECPTSLVLSSGEPFLCHDDFYFHRNGGAFSVLTATTPIINQGKICGALVVFIHAGQTDATHSLITEEHIGAIMTLDAEGLITSFSDSLARLTGYSIREMVGQSPSLLKSNVHTRSFFRDLWNTLKHDKHWQGLIWNRCQDGSIRPFWVSMNAICDGAGETTQYVAIYGEATPNSSPEAQLQFLASHDNLTGLPNRAQLSRRLRQAIARANRLDCMLAVAFIDLDHFKIVNDTLGHDVGDTYLIEVARRLASNCREEDTLARWGGDEFVLLMEDVQQAGDPLLFAQRLVASLSEPVQLGGQSLPVSASIGLAMFPADAQTTGSLIQAADRAMYEAKTLGRNRIVQYRDMV
jgi:diguanylate cyclase (GGDEF)-like protein/PAS domain S-box-containing protein